jgi:hypothetical protein
MARLDDAATIKEMGWTWLTRSARLGLALALLGALVVAALPRSASAAGGPDIWLTESGSPDPFVQVNGDFFTVGGEVGIGFYSPGEAYPFLEERTTAGSYAGYVDGSFGKTSALHFCPNSGQSIEIQAYDFGKQVWSNLVTAKVCLDGGTDGPAVDFDAAALVTVDEAALGLSVLAGEGQVNIRSYRCDDAHGEIFNQLIAECTAIGGQYFTLTDASTSYSGYSNPDQPITWSGVASGTISLKGLLTTEWETPVVFCEGAGPNGGHDLATLPVNGDTISTALNADESLDCFWFNMLIGARAKHEAGSVTLTKYACPEGYDSEHASLDELRWDCAETMNGVRFALVPVLADAGQQDVDFTSGTQTTGGLAPGLATWETEPGDLTLAEEIPAGYGEPIVYCESWLPDFGFTGYASTPASNGQIAFTLAAGEDLSCEWYNVPADEWDHDGGYGDHDNTGCCGHDEGYDDSDEGSCCGHDSSDTDDAQESEDVNGEGQSGLIDSDDDGLSDDEELDYGTDPSSRDTDGDAIPDGDDVYLYGTDPNAFDTDGDGLGDGEEAYEWGSDPLNPDTDGDGSSDGDEILYYGTDPVDSSSF